MPKQYILNINYDEITKDNLNFTYRFQQHDGACCTEEDGWLKFENGDEVKKSKIKPEWLTEIKEPLPFKVWFHSVEVERLAYHFNDRNAAEAICLAWVENQKLGTVVDEEADNNKFKELTLSYQKECLYQTFSLIQARLWFFNAALKHARSQK